MASTGRLRNPQLSLKLDVATPPVQTGWSAGDRLNHLGQEVTVMPSPDFPEATLHDEVLHLPLPPHSTARQVRDAAEAWQREQAKRHIERCIADCWTGHARGVGPQAEPPPRLVLSFAARGPWIDIDGTETLRCRWRLIEQAPALIDQLVARAVANLPARMPMDDLFGFSFSNRAA